MSENIKELDKEYIASTYNRFDLELVSGKGSILYDEAGKRYIDLGSGIAVNIFGAADDVWKEAVTAQLDAIQHTSNLYYSIPAAKLAEKLCKRTGMSKVFFSNSGAEANECAIKAARKYSSDKYGEGRSTVITLINSFHGRTITTLSATGQENFHKHFGPFTGGFVYAPANDLAAAKKLAEESNACAIMVELVQGEGGVLPLDSDYVKGLAAYTAENDILLIVDEVQTGNGRTGELYAYMNFGIKPDIVSTAKGLAGGLPFGATLLGEKLNGVFDYGSHGSTFGGNPVCAAGALSILDRIDDKLLDEVRIKSDYIKNELCGAKGVKSISGMGLMLGIETDGEAKKIANECIKNGVIVLTAKTKVRLLPALNIPMNTLKEAIEVLKMVIAENN